MTRPIDTTGAAVPTEVIPQLTAAAYEFAARYEEPNPKSILAVSTTRAKALEVLFRAWMPGTEAVQVYAVVMTGRFASYRGGIRTQPEQLPLISSAFLVVFDADTLRSLDSGGPGGRDHLLGSLPRLGPVTVLKGAPDD